MIKQQDELQAILATSTYLNVGLGVRTDFDTTRPSTVTESIPALPQLTAIEKVLAKYQFNDQVANTAQGTEMSLVLPKGTSIADLFNEVNKAYLECASDQQKKLIANVVYNGQLFKEPNVIEKAAEDKTISLIPMVKESTHKTLADQIDKETGKLKFVDGVELSGESKINIAAIACLKLLKSVSEGILVTPGQANGDALEGKASRALGGGYVHLYDGGLHANDWHDGGAGPKLGCAGSLSSPAE